jgi:general secretion pathway protein C
MNKRLPLLLSLLGMILLAASLAYWLMQIYQPPQRPLAVAPHTGLPDPAPDAAAMLFGGQPAAAATATNYQLTGVVAALGGGDSVAIIVAEGSPPKALRVGRELAPGVTLAEVHARYVMLRDAGVMKRLDLATDAKAAAPMGGQPGAMAGAETAPAPNMQPGMQLPAQAPNMPAPAAPTTPTAGAPQPDPAAVPEPPMAPGPVQPQSQTQPQSGASPPVNQNSAPGQNTRTTGAPVSQNPTTQ